MVEASRAQGKHGAKNALTAHHPVAEKAAVKKERCRPCRPQGAQARSQDRPTRDGRDGARCFRARSPHAIDWNPCHQRSPGDVRPRRARAALGRYHQGGRRTSRQPCDTVCRCRQKRPHHGRGAQGFLRSADAGARRRGFACRQGGGERSAMPGGYFGQASGAGGRRFRPPARRPGKPDRQCGEVHRTGRRRADG